MDWVSATGAREKRRRSQPEPWDLPPQDFPGLGSRWHCGLHGHRQYSRTAGLAVQLRDHGHWHHPAQCFSTCLDSRPPSLMPALHFHWSLTVKKYRSDSFAAESSAAPRQGRMVWAVWIPIGSLWVYLVSSLAGGSLNAPGNGALAGGNLHGLVCS